MDEKVYFIKTGMFELLQKLTEPTTPTWGKMNAQQAIEHLADFFDVSTGKIVFDLVTPEEHLPKYREFLYSEKQFRENTQAPVSVLGSEPMPARQPSFASSLTHLSKSVNQFFVFFESTPGQKTMHPVFGPLTFDEWVLLHYKHVRHHLRQFALL